MIEAEEWWSPFQSSETLETDKEHWNEYIKAKSSIIEDSIISDLVLTLEACF